MNSYAKRTADLLASFRNGWHWKARLTPLVNEVDESTGRALYFALQAAVTHGRLESYPSSEEEEVVDLAAGPDVL